MEIYGSSYRSTIHRHTHTQLFLSLLEWNVWFVSFWLDDGIGNNENTRIQCNRYLISFFRFLSPLVLPLNAGDWKCWRRSTQYAHRAQQKLLTGEPADVIQFVAAHNGASLLSPSAEHRGLH